MKILVTGMTARHTGTAQREYLTVIQPLIHILKEMGHYVYQSTVAVNEDLSGWDKIIVYLFPLEKLGATRRFGAFDALARYPDKCIISFDDWQYYQFQMYMSSCIGSGRYWNWVDKYPEFITKEDYQAIKDGGQEVRTRLERIAEQLREDIKFPVIMPCFTWGNNDFKLKTTGTVKYYDPSRSAIEWVEQNYMRLEFPPIRKIKVWVLGSLFDNTNYVKQYNFSWPVLHYGHKKTQKVVDEQDLCNIYNDCYGIISHKYATSGDGWWRARWIFSYMFECIIHASDEEMGLLPADTFLPRLDSFENAKDDVLIEIVKQQKFILNKFFMPKDGAVNIINNILKG